MIEIDKKIDVTVKLLKTHYWINIIVLATLFILAMFKLTPFFEEKQVVNIVVERYIIVITIMTIPGILKLFSVLLKKVPKEARPEIVFSKYKKAYYTRLYTIGLLTLINIFLYDYSGNLNFFWITAVLFILYIYCKPSFPELKKLLISEEENSGVDTNLNQEFIIEDKDSGETLMQENILEDFDETDLKEEKNNE